MSCPSISMFKTIFSYLLLSALLLHLLLSLVSAQTAERDTYARLVKTGFEHLAAKNYQSAREALVEALRYHDRDAAVHLGLGLVYFHDHDDGAAERELSLAASLDPKLTEAQLWLGELAYRRDDLEQTLLHWEKALELDPSYPHLQARLDRIRKEYKTEKDFNRALTGHFIAKYEGREKIETGRIVLRILEEAYGDIGKSLSYYPDREIQVILYSSQQFLDVTDAPPWSSGIYDGKIRLPIGGIEQETPALRRLLYHEYTHAIIRKLAPGCPTWLNEGLAQHFEGRKLDAEQKKMMRKLAQSGNLPPLSALESSFTGMNDNQAMVSYLLSLSAIHYVIDAFGLYRVTGIVENIGSGMDIAGAVDKELMISYHDLSIGWKRSLE